MSTKRVAVVAYHSSPLREPGVGDAGGMTVYVRESARWLSGLGVRTDVFTRADSPHEPRVASLGPGVRVISIEAGPKAPLDRDQQRLYLNEFTAGVRAFRAAEGLSYDLVHSHYWQSGVSGRDLAAGWAVPLVHSHHTLGKVKNRYLAPGDAAEPPERLDGEAAVISAANVLVASTDDEWKQMTCLYSASHDQLKTIHPGVDHDRFHPGDRDAARAELGLTDELVLLYVGRIQRLKGIELAIRSVEQLVPALERDVVLLVVGGASGPGGEAELKRLEKLAAELQISDRIRFVGPQPHARLPQFYRAADTSVVCSHSESFGLAALEAQACGIPVVGTAVGGLAHIVRDGQSGFLVDTRDPAVFAARLKTLLSDEELRDSFGATAEISAARFSWRRTAAELLDLYDCLVREELPEACTC